MAAYNGEAFLQQQIDTLAAQTVAHVDIWFSDDGSSDGTKAIAQAAAKRWTKGGFTILDGPSKGFAENFRSLLVNRAIDADYFAFCDQDDLWDEDKLAHAIAWLETQDAARPALYCTRTRIVAADGTPTGMSRLFSRPPSFRNALVQSIAGGNTMVMNRAARMAVMRACERVGFVSHDWWCYLVVSGTGGVVHYCPTPRIGYRQHEDNLVGENKSWRAKLTRLKRLFTGTFENWNDRNLASLEACGDMLSQEARDVMARYEKARSAPLPTRLSALHRSGVFRQSTLGNLGLYIACMLKKL